MSRLSHVISIFPVSVNAAIGLICLLLTSCEPEPQRNEQAVDDTQLISLFLAANPEYESVFKQVPKTDKIPFLLDVYVDHSASMRGYLEFQNPGTAKRATAKTDEAAPQLFTLLRQFANQTELMGFNAFGTVGDDANSTQETITPLGRTPPVMAKDYTRLNNDYAELIKLIQDRPRQVDGKPVQHVIITDGVQSHHDPGNGSALSKTVRALQNWIDKGGVVDIRLATSSFSGVYYSEELRARQKKYSFEGAVSDRPFLIIGLLSGEEMLPSWRQFWERSGLKAVQIEAQALFPDQESQSTQFKMALESKVSKVLAPEIRFADVWDLKPVETIDHGQNLFSARIVQYRTKDNNNPETYPVCVRITGTEDDLEEAFKNSRPTLKVWRLTKAPPPAVTPLPEKDTKQIDRVAPTELVFWKELGEDDKQGLPSDVRAILAATPKPLQPNDDDGKPFADGGLRLLLRLPLQKRGETADLIVMTVESAPKDEKVPEAFVKYSCLDDSSAQSLSRIYNLQQLVEQFSHSIKPVAKKTGFLVVTHR